MDKIPGEVKERVKKEFPNFPFLHNALDREEIDLARELVGTNSKLPPWTAEELINYFEDGREKVILEEAEKCARRFKLYKELIELERKMYGRSGLDEY